MLRKGELMFSWLAETIGQVVGETVHQTGKAVDDLLEAPSKFMEGYDKELFNEKQNIDTTEAVDNNNTKEQDEVQGTNS